MKGKIPPVFALWILITVVMVIFIGLSFLDDIKIGNYTLTKARFPETLMKQAEPQQEEFPTIVNDTVPVPVETYLEPDTTVHNVLIFGDSMTHHLAMSIAKYGTKNRYKVTGVTWESSSIPGWADSEKLKKYLEMSNPDYVFISLGSNEMGLKNFDQRLPYVQKILAQLDSLPYVWVGPPLWKEDKGFYTMLNKALPPGHLFRTENLDLERGPDHIHPTKKGADMWADTLMRWVRKSSHPILTEKPDSGTTTKGHKIIYLHPED